MLLGGMKSVKMLGLTQIMSTIIQRLRVNEIKTSKVFRKILVVTLMLCRYSSLRITSTVPKYNLAVAPINLAPVATFTLYVITSILRKKDTLLTVQAFTSIALMALLTTPVLIFIQSLLIFIQSIASFNRIQEYCTYIGDLKAEDNDQNAARNDHGSGNNPRCVTPTYISEDSPLMREHAISFDGESFGWDQNEAVILKNLKVNIQPGAVTAIVGPVGSGKSAFLNSLLGEMISMSPTSEELPRGRLGLHTAAYCSQQPWLENKTIQQNIVGPTLFDREWYERVVSSCGLNADMEALPNGDDTRVGSKGINVSGGQKQRIVSLNGSTRNI
jgi:ATP-binding cassette subfamily C (CFTR/MRP) protein 1